jgi:aryl-alcohol dehydrogenase-like predicted oxidoreductase
MNTEYVDLLWVHTREAWTPVVEVMRALDDLVRSGKVLYVGVSDWPAWEVAEARTPEGDLLPMAEAFDLAVVAWGPLAEGRLTGKYREGDQGRLRDDAAEGIFQHSWSDPDETVDLVVRIAADIGCTPAQVAIAWLAARRGNIIPLLGATSPTQLDENLAAAGMRLDDDRLRVLDKASAPALGFPHDLLQRENVTNGTYGDQWRLVDDRRTTRRRSTHI